MKIQTCRLMSTKQLIAQTDSGWGYESSRNSRINANKAKQGNKSKKAAKGRR